MIIAAAIFTPNGRVYVGKRHGDCYKNMKIILKMDKPDERSVKAVQGFINDKLQFLNREEAYYEAYSCGQCKEQIKPREKHLQAISKMFVDNNAPFIWKPQLASEDLW